MHDYTIHFISLLLIQGTVTK